MRKLILAVFIVFFLAGCAGTFQPTGSCVDGDSVILKVTHNNPAGLDKTLLAVNFAGLESGAYTADQVMDLLDVVEDIAIDGVSYVDLFSLLSYEVERARKYGAAMIVLGVDVQQISASGGPMAVTECDKELILAHIAHQRAIVALY